MTAPKMEELWEKYAPEFPKPTSTITLDRAQFLAALREACAAVRARDAEICHGIAFDQRRNKLTGHGAFLCKDAISREPLP